MTDRAAAQAYHTFFAFKPLNCRSNGPDRFKTSAFYEQYSMVNEFPMLHEGASKDFKVPGQSMGTEAAVESRLAFFPFYFLKDIAFSCV